MRAIALKKLLDPRRPLTYGIVQAGPHIEDGTPYIRPTDMTDTAGVADESKLLRTSIEISKAYERARLKTGDVVLSIGPSFGKVMIVPETLEGANLTQGTARLAPRPEVNHRWLYWVLQSRPSVDYWNSVVAGGTFRALNLGPLGETPVTLVDTDRQKVIADFLDDQVSRIDRIITARYEQRSLVAKWQQSRLSSIMDQQVTLSGVAPLRRFCAGIEQGSSPVAADRPAEPGECGVLKTSAVFRGAFFGKRYKSIQSYKADPRHRVRSRDVIIIRGSGSADLVGDAAMAVLGEEHPPLYLSDLTYRLRGLRISPEYAVLAITSARGRSELGSRVRHGSGPAKARGDDILAIPVPVASPTEQLACVNEETSMRNQSATFSSQVTRSIVLLTEYRTSLITAAVTGDLDVTTAGSNIPG